MNKAIIFGICICLILVGCGTASTSFNTQHELNCQKVCLNEDLSLDYVASTSTTVYCYCQRIIQLPNT